MLAALALTPSGPELAANRCCGESCLGLVGDVGLDGLVAGYAVERGGARELLLATDAGLDWLRTPLPLSVHVSLSTDLTGRVQGASSGAVVALPRGRRRLAHGRRQLRRRADGSFAASDPAAATPPAAYRAVWVDPTTSIPYAALLATRNVSCPQSSGVRAQAVKASTAACAADSSRAVDTERRGCGKTAIGSPQVGRIAVEMLKKENFAKCGRSVLRTACVRPDRSYCPPCVEYGT